MNFAWLREITFSAHALWLIWCLMFVAWIVMSAILMYHWNSYSTEDPKVRRMKIIYFVGALLLFASATTFIFSL